MAPNPYGFQEVEPEFLEVMGNTLRIYRRTGATNRYGEDTHQAAPIEVPCYITDERTTYRDNDGENQVSAGKAYLGWLIPWLSTRDKIMTVDLEGNWGRTFAGVIRVESGPDGPHHQEIFFGQHGGTKGGMIK